MTSGSNNRADFLRSLARSKTTKTLEHAMKVIDKMEADQIPISFQSVSKIAKVSKTWLYSNEIISNKIRDCRGKNKSNEKLLENNRAIQSKNKEIEKLKKQIIHMENEILDLKSQLDTVYAELYEQSTKNI